MSTCIICGQPITQAVDKRHPPAQACSKKCRGELSWRNRIAKGEKPGRNYPQAKCQGCGKTFGHSYQRLRFCSVKCSAQAWGHRNPRRIVKWTEWTPLATWKPGTVTDAGYVAVYLPQHPRASTKGRFMEHRLVMEQHLGRFLEPEEKVHHRSGVKTDNRIENLQIVTHARPNGTVICPHCRREFQVH